ncbi:MAG: hypothetical protein HY040_25045 [Planctomycetes bacterium]|nr:hypothetical protein [Planctomycetota bacterium]
MRFATAFIFVGLLAAVTGCESTRWSWLKNDKPSRSPGPDGAGLPTVASLVDYMNDNARRMDNVRVADLDLTVTPGGVSSYGLTGQMVAQKPRGFRMSAKAIGNPEVDLGSNDQEFWYWVKRAQPPYQVFCGYKDIGEGRISQMPIPFQPEWVMEAMGMGPYGPPEKYKMEHDNKTIRLVEKSTSPQGVPVRKVIVMERRPVNPPTPQVIEFLLLEDKTGKEICSARITETQVDRGTGSILPRRIELRYPAEKMKLAMKLDSTTVNQQLPPTVFTRQLMPGVQSFNLATMKVDNTPPLQAFSDNSRFDPKLKTVQGFGQ